ncbi:YidC/Oxa1 family membrane protein insertase [Streptomyces sp. NPDC092296]|uniref:YidC/Oxa1 family membrane protein insertase n=1 Tax=Streptomyces sp. NPDC092296 TaxID=3366012 RepID=UPI003806B4CC
MSVLSVLDPAVGLAHHAVAGLAQVVPTAAAIVVFTICVRLLLHPLARASARGEKARARLAPQVAEVRRRHHRDPERLQQALTELYRKEGASPVAGCLPMLLQMPFFSVMYRLFTRPTAGGAPDDLLHHTLFGVPLGSHVTAAHGPQLAVFLGLYALLAAVGAVSFVRARRTAAATPAPTPTEQAKQTNRPTSADPSARAAALAPYLSFGTVLFAALVPLAAGLYLLTTTAWTVAERALLHRPAPAPTPLTTGAATTA